MILEDKYIPVIFKSGKYVYIYNIKWSCISVWMKLLYKIMKIKD